MAKKTAVASGQSVNVWGSRSALKQQAYVDLKQLILAGDLPAGSVQSVRQLALRLEMSKTPVQAAIERLEAEGLLMLAPQQGVVIRELSIQDIANHYEIRQAIEPFVVRRLAGRLNELQIEILHQNLEAFRKCLSEMNLPGLRETDAEFHQHLCGFQHNQEIQRVMKQLRDKLHRVIFQVTNQFPERLHETYDEHKAIVESISSGDAEQAAHLMHMHLEQGLQRFLPKR